MGISCLYLLSGPEPAVQPSSRTGRHAGMIIDSHAHMISRTTDDYEAMAKSGVVAVIEPAFWLGQPRTNVGSFIDYFLLISGFERFRTGQFTNDGCAEGTWL
jgi:uncharacterized protein